MIEIENFQINWFFYTFHFFARKGGVVLGAHRNTPGSRARSLLTENRCRHFLYRRVEFKHFNCQEWFRKRMSFVSDKINEDFLWMDLPYKLVSNR